jgi:hypothetical protein
MKSKNLIPTVAVNPRASLRLLIDELTTRTKIVIGTATNCSTNVLIVVIAAAEL